MTLTGRVYRFYREVVYHHTMPAGLIPAVFANTDEVFVISCSELSSARRADPYPVITYVVLLGCPESDWKMSDAIAYRYVTCRAGFWEFGLSDSEDCGQYFCPSIYSAAFDNNLWLEAMLTFRYHKLNCIYPFRP